MSHSNQLIHDFQMHNNAQRDHFAFVCLVYLDACRVGADSDNNKKTRSKWWCIKCETSNELSLGDSFFLSMRAQHHNGGIPIKNVSGHVCVFFVGELWMY